MIGKGVLRKEEVGFHQPYSDFAKVLRTWFIAYGIGAPVFFMSNLSFRTAILGSGQAQRIAYLFFGGILAQIIVAIVYKTAMWYLYIGELDEHRQESLAYRISDRISECYVPEFLFDAATLVLFGYATYLATKILFGTGPTDGAAKVETLAIMNIRVLLPLIITSAVTILGWYVAYRSLKLRDIAAMQKQKRVEAILEAFQKLKRISHCTWTDSAAQDFESAVTTIQLFGTRSQIAATREMVSEATAPGNKWVSFDKLLWHLRNGLRKELRLPQLDQKLCWVKVKDGKVAGGTNDIVP